MIKVLGSLIKVAAGVGVIALAYDFGKFNGVKTLIDASLENGGTIEWNKNGMHITMTVKVTE